MESRRCLGNRGGERRLADDLGSARKALRRGICGLCWVKGSPSPLLETIQCLGRPFRGFGDQGAWGLVTKWMRLMAVASGILPTLPHIGFSNQLRVRLGFPRPPEPCKENWVYFCLPVVEMRLGELSTGNIPQFNINASSSFKDRIRGRGVSPSWSKGSLFHKRDCSRGSLAD